MSTVKSGDYVRAFSNVLCPDGLCPATSCNGAHNSSNFRVQHLQIRLLDPF